LTNNPVTEALRLLDPKDDSHWTTDGAPRLDVVQALSGVSDLKRADLVALAPQFTRESMNFGPLFTDEGATDGAAPEVDEVEQTRLALVAKQKEIDSQRAKINAETAALKKLQDEADVLTRALEPAGPTHQDNQRSIMAFLAGQNQVRIDRHNIRQAALRGIDPASLNAKSPLDQAMARKRQRGMNRPPVRATQV